MYKLIENFRKSWKPTKERNQRQEDLQRFDELEIPKKIHYFWQGRADALLKYASNMKASARINSPKYQVRLHILPESNEDLKTIEEVLDNIKVKDLNKEKWFGNFKKTDRYRRQFLAATHGSRPHAASAADVVKTELIFHKGGVWNDVDNKPKAPLPDEMRVPRGKFLTAGPVKFKRWGGQVGFHSSTFATHTSNEVLAKINKLSLKKFKTHEGVIYEVHADTDDPDTHFSMISETAGSLHMSTEIMRRDPELATQIHYLYEEGKTYNEKQVIFDKYFHPVVTTGLGPLDEKQIETLARLLVRPKALR